MTECFLRSSYALGDENQPLKKLSDASLASSCLVRKSMASREVIYLHLPKHLTNDILLRSK